MSRHPNNPDREYQPWQHRVKFKLLALEAIPHPSMRELYRMRELRKKLYGNLQWFREKRA